MSDAASQANSKIPGAESGIEIKKTLCDICNPLSHCGIDAYVKDGVVVKVEGSKEHPHNRGTLCSKGAASRQYIYHQDRVLHPLKRVGAKGEGRFEAVSWDAALDDIAAQLLKIKNETGPESAVFYVGYPKWMRPFVKRLAHSYGSPNYGTESSTCQTAMAMAFKLNYGYAGNPDIKNTNCLVFWSNNPFYTNTTMVQPILEARDRGMKIIEVGPLVTPTTAHADIHLRIRPGTSGALGLGLANVIIEEDLYDHAFVDNWTVGFEEYRRYVAGFTPEKTEAITGVPADLVRKAARMYANAKPGAMMTSASPTVQHTNGVQNSRAFTALIGLTGNWDVKGGNYVVPPGFLYLPNGIVTRQHEFEQTRKYADMAPRIGQAEHGVWCDLEPQSQVMHLPDAIQTGKPYPVRSVLGFGINYRMWPASDYMADSLKKLDLFVAMDLFMTDTAKLADYVLPVCSSFERSEFKFYRDRHVMFTQPVIKPLGESRSDTEIIQELGKRIAPDDKLLAAGQDAWIEWIMEPTGIKIADVKKHQGAVKIESVVMPPYKKYEKKGFPTLSGKMEFTSLRLKNAGLEPLPKFEEPWLSPVSTPETAKDFPLVLTTGARLPMFVHSRTFRLAWTKTLRPKPMADINPLDAQARGIKQGDPVELSSPRGKINVFANISENVAPGVVNMIHSNPEADVNLLIDKDYLDPLSGFPGFKSQLCEMKKM